MPFLRSGGKEAVQVVLVFLPSVTVDSIVKDDQLSVKFQCIEELVIFIIQENLHPLFSTDHNSLILPVRDCSHFWRTKPMLEASLVDTIALPSSRVVCANEHVGSASDVHWNVIVVCGYLSISVRSDPALMIRAIRT